MNRPETVLIRLTIAQADALHYAAMEKCAYWRERAVLNGVSSSRTHMEWQALAAASEQIGLAIEVALQRIAKHEQQHQKEPPQGA